MTFLGALEPGAPKAVTGRCWQLDWKARLHQDLPCTSCSILWLIDADLGVQLWLLNGSDICSSMIIACNSHPHGSTGWATQAHSRPCLSWHFRAPCPTSQASWLVKRCPGGPFTNLSTPGAAVCKLDVASGASFSTQRYPKVFLKNNQSTKSIINLPRAWFQRCTAGSHTCRLQAHVL